MTATDTQSDPMNLGSEFFAYILKLTGVSVACGLVMVAVGFVPTDRLAGASGVSAMFAAVSATTFVSIVGAIPVAHALAFARQRLPIFALMATTIRFLLVLLVVATLVLTDLVDRLPFVSWVVISYLVLLAADTTTTVCMTRRAERRTT